MMRLICKRWIARCLGLGVVILVACPASSEPRHGLSTFGALKYPANFERFDYVEPTAPKGGRLALIGHQATTSFDSFNPFILKGTAAQGMRLIYDTLMSRSLDEPDAVYGLIAETAELSDDRTELVFHLRPQARFADGAKLTADDVVFSLLTIKEKGHPSAALPLKGLVSASAPDPATVKLKLAGDNLRDLPVNIALLPIFSKAYYDTHDFLASSLEPPLGSGPYKLGDFKAGAYVTFKRRSDYWAADLPVMRGQFNFDEVRYDYYRERVASLEAIKSGEIDFREEFTSKDWATAYGDLPQIKDGRLQRLVLPDGLPSGAQGFFFNLRRGKFQDDKVRLAFNLAFDFEWTNKNLFFSLYKRSTSLFENSDLKANGLPTPEELALLEPFRAEIAPEVFTAAPYSPPVTDGSGSDRKLLREAAGLLDAAGYSLQNGKRVSKSGEPLTVEFLTEEPSFDRVILPYIKNLEALGIQASIRRVDDAQYELRMKQFDFDITTRRYTMTSTPGSDLETIFSSQAADTQGSYNISGLKSKAVDALSMSVAKARSRADLLTRMHALDRVLRQAHFLVHQWYKAEHDIVVWDKYGRPTKIAPYEELELGSAENWVRLWWFDAAKAARLKVN